MNKKITPEQALKSWDEQLAYSPHELDMREALREAIKQRDEAYAMSKEPLDLNLLAQRAQEFSSGAISPDGFLICYHAMLRELATLRADKTRLTEALTWYATGRHIDHSWGHPSGTYLKVEDGVKARGALKSP